MALVDNITSYWKGDSNGSFDDAVGSNDGSLTNITYTSSGIINGGQSFNGSSSVISVADAANLKGMSAFTVGCWAWFDDVSGSRWVMGKGDFSGSNTNYIIFFEGGKIACRANINGTYERLTGTTTLSTDEWYLIIITYDGSNFRLHINNSIEDTESASGSVGSGSLPLTFGSQTSSTLWFNGILDEAFIWGTRKLSSDELTELYNGREGLQYPFAASPDVDIQAEVNVSTFSIPTPIIVAQSSTSIDAEVNTLTSSVQTPTLSFPRTVSGEVNNVTSSVQEPIINTQQQININAETNSSLFSVQVASVDTTKTVNVSADINTSTFSIQTPVITTSGTININSDVLTSTFSIQAPLINTEQQINISADVNNGTLTVNTVTVSASGSVNVNVVPILGTFSVPSVTINAQQTVQISADLNALTFSIPTPTIQVNINFPYSAVASINNIGYISSFSNNTTYISTIN